MRLSRVHILCLAFLNGLNVASGVFTYYPFNPATVSIVETTRSITRLESIVQCSETNTSRICTCLVSGNVPFETWWLAGDSGYYVYYDNTAPLITGTYSLTVECRSNNMIGTDQRQTLKVQVNPNSPPVIQNYNKDSASADGKSSPQNSVVYTTRYKDPEDDAVIFSMTVTPNLGHFIIGAGNGKVYSTIDLRSATIDKYTFTITADDSYNTVKDFVVTLTITNRNVAPQIQNLPATIIMKETAKKDDVVITLVLDDPDPFVNMDPFCVTKDPSDMERLVFDMPKHQIRVAYDNALDYETKGNISITCSWCDGYLCDSNAQLAIISENVNEAPVWSDETYFCNIDEGNAGGPTCSLNAVLKDPENNPMTVEVVTTNNLRIFKYDYAFDLMSFTADYDLDQAHYDSDVTAIMTATDSKGMTSTATVKIHVIDVNDNKCKTDSLKTFNLNRHDQLQKLGAFPLVDEDATDPNNNVHFEIASVSPSTSTDHILVTRNGEIYYTNLIPPDQGTINMKFILYCIDGGIPRQTATATLLVNYIVPTTTFVMTTYTTTTTERSVWSYEEFRGTFGTLITLVGLGLTLLIGSLVALYCARKGGWKNWYQRQQLRVKPAIEKDVPLRPLSPWTSRSLPPVEQGPSLNRQWENIAWSQKESTPAEGIHYFHYH